MSTKDKTFTLHQQKVVDSYRDAHGIEASQISFDGDGVVPSFDHNAVSLLSLKLTDIDIRPTNVVDTADSVRVYSDAILPDGRVRGAFGSCRIGEVLANGETVTTTTAAEGVALSRSFRQAIRNVGIDLHKAHQQFMQTGKVQPANAAHDPRTANYREAHMHAEELELIIGDDRKPYEDYLELQFGEGIRSSKLLNDLDMHKLLVNLRYMVGIKRSSSSAVKAAA